MKRLTYQGVKDYIENEGYKLISDDYINSKTKLEMQCSENHIFEMKFNSFKNGTRCPNCHGNLRLTYDYVKCYIEQEGYELLSDNYINNRGKLDIRCSEGHVFSACFNNFKNGSRCPDCCGNAKFSYDDVKNILANKEYTLLSTSYINKDDKLDIMCPKGHVYSTSLNVFNRGFGCPHCSGKAKHSISFIRQYLKKRGYKLKSDCYRNALTKLSMECDNGHEFKMTFSDFKNGNRRCPICSVSQGENEIIHILDKLQINYIPQYRFDDCRFKNKLPFDFYLSDYNILIEYDGIQHFEIIDFFGGSDGFIATKIRDTVKNIYCQNNNIKLIRIPYWDFDNIENIIIYELNKHE